MRCEGGGCEGGAWAAQPPPPLLVAAPAAGRALSLLLCALGTMLGSELVLGISFTAAVWAPAPLAISRSGLTILRPPSFRRSRSGLSGDRVPSFAAACDTAMETSGGCTCFNGATGWVLLLCASCWFASAASTCGFSIMMADSRRVSCAAAYSSAPAAAWAAAAARCGWGAAAASGCGACGAAVEGQGGAAAYGCIENPFSGLGQCDKPYRLCASYKPRDDGPKPGRGYPRGADD